MRKIRNAAIAGMTAVTLVAGLSTTALAEDNDLKTKQQQEIEGGKDASDRTSSEDYVKENGKKKSKDVDCRSFVADRAVENGGKALDFDKVHLGDADCTTRPFLKDLKDYAKKPDNSSVWGFRYGAVQDVYGTDLLGENKNFDDQPVWAQIWYVATILGVIGTVIGLGYLPVMNQLKAMGFII